jgi:hypothetical protein
VLACAVGQRRERALDRRRVRGHRCARPVGLGHGGPRQLEGVDVREHRLVSVGSDARGETELLEQLRHLLGRGDDHLDVASHRRLELDRALHRPREAEDRRERGPQIVHRE